MKCYRIGGTGLYAESAEYVWNMLKDEANGNLESWLVE
mgnify:CR=1 FL=1